MRTSTPRAAATKAAAVLFSLICAAGTGAITAGTAMADTTPACNGTYTNYYTCTDGPNSDKATNPTSCGSNYSCTYQFTDEAWCQKYYNCTYHAPTYYYAHLYYDANGGKNAPSSQTRSSTSSYGSATFTISRTEPTRDGYDFKGWATSKNATSAAYQPGSTISVGYNSSETLYAVWEKSKPKDTTKPVISGAEDKSITVGDQFDPKTGVSANDDTDGDITANITITGSVDASKPGAYELTYTVQDAAGNQTEAKRTITVNPLMSANMPETGALTAPLALMGAFLPLSLAGVTAARTRRAGDD